VVDHCVTGLDAGLRGDINYMLTMLLVLLTVGLIAAAGEAVRGQCRRMLSRPVVPAHAAAQPLSTMSVDAARAVEVAV
jgi:hypothetical protein